MCLTFDTITLGQLPSSTTAHATGRSMSVISTCNWGRESDAVGDGRAREYDM
jgi:hypothetical protein